MGEGDRLAGLDAEAGRLGEAATAAVAPVAPEPPPTKEQMLLTEIRDLLRSRQGA